MSVQSPSTIRKVVSQVPPLAWVALVLGLLSVWAVWPRLVSMSQVWYEDQTYSHGYLVPLFSLFLLFLKRKELAAIKLQPHWSGVPVIALAGLCQFAGLYLSINWLETASIMVYLAGICLVVGGTALIKQTWRAITFLTFMIPLPYFIESAMRQPLRLLAAKVSNWLLQLLGMGSLLNGTVIDIDGHELGVEDACSGIAMLMTFFALSVGMAMVVRRPLLDKLVLVLSAIPIAILCNILRITITGLLYGTVGEAVGKFVYHDLAGLMMMPMGIGFMWLELIILDHLLVTPPSPSERSYGHLVIPGLPQQPSTRGMGRT